MTPEEEAHGHRLDAIRNDILTSLTISLAHLRAARTFDLCTAALNKAAAPAVLREVNKSGRGD